MGVPYAEVIGDPIAHSKSPMIHKFWLRKLGLDHDFRRTRVATDQLASFFESRLADPEWCGCNVTIPHKQLLFGHLHTVAPDASFIGAVNTVLRAGSRTPGLAGRNTDWGGFVDPLQPWLQSLPTYAFAHVIGTGGAAAAICYALDRAGFTIVNVARDRSKALALRRRLELFDDDLIVELDSLGCPTQPPDWGDDRLDLLVNATPLGMAGYPELEVNLDGLPPGLIVYDIVYHPLETHLLRKARRKGMPTIDGLSMLIGQAAQAFALFFCAVAPREHDQELRELLTR